MLSCVRLFETSWTVALQALLSVEFSRQEYWSEFPFPTLGELPQPGIELTSVVSPSLTGDFFTIWATREAPRASRCCQLVGPAHVIFGWFSKAFAVRFCLPVYYDYPIIGSHWTWKFEFGNKIFSDWLWLTLGIEYETETQGIFFILFRTYLSYFFFPHIPHRLLLIICAFIYSKINTYLFRVYARHYPCFFGKEYWIPGPNLHLI